jgi:hypothetical protein
MASGHVNRVNRPNTWLHRPMLQREESPCQPAAVHTWTQTGPSESVATLDRGPRLEDHVTLSELGRIDEAF